VVPESAVLLVVGVAEQVNVPDVVGMQAEEAARVLQASGLRPEQGRQVPDKGVGIGLAQEPKAGTPVPPDSTVTLAIGVQRWPTGGEIITRLGSDLQFAQFGVSVEEFDARLQALRINSREQTEVLLNRSAAELRQTLGLSSIRRAQSFKRLLRQALASPTGGE
jgi:hypothetical protein